MILSGSEPWSKQNRAGLQYRSSVISIVPCSFNFGSVIFSWFVLFLTYWHLLKKSAGMFSDLRYLMEKHRSVVCETNLARVSLEVDGDDRIFFKTNIALEESVNTVKCRPLKM